jgi:hypothetical protein
MMRYLLLSVVFSGLFLSSYSQDSASIYDTHLYKKGIYKNFKEFRSNQPSEDGKLVVKDKTPAAQIYLLSSRNQLMILDSAGQEHKVKNFWGYSDGTAAYIRDNGLNKFDEIGYYCLYQVHAITSAPANRATEGIIFNNTPPATVSKKVLNIVTGDVYDLTLFNLRKYILPQDTALLREFNEDRQNRQKLVYYIQKFNQRNNPVW